MLKSRIFAYLIVALLAVAFVAAPTADTQAQQAASPKIVFVDLQRALNEVEDGKQAKARLKREFDQKQRQLDQKQEQVKKLKESLESQGMVLSEDARRQQAMQLQQQMYELQQLYLNLQGELAQKEAEATKTIFDRMGTILEAIGKERGYDFILERTESSILFSRDGLDITNELIRRYNAR